MTDGQNSNLHEAVIAYMPDRAMRKLIGEGVKLTEIFTPENIRACQQTIDDARTTFFQTAGTALLKIEESLQSAPSENTDTGLMYETIGKCAMDIKGSAELFGFDLIATISNHIIDYCEPGDHPPQVRARLIADLVKMLRVAIKEKTIDPDGSLEKALRESLRKVTK